MGFVITKKWLRDYGTKGCGWTRQQLAVLGVVGKSISGWMNRAIGKTISLEQKAEFERLAERRQENLATAPASGDPVLGKFFNYMNLIDTAREKLSVAKEVKAKKVVRLAAEQMQVRVPADMRGKTSLLRRFLGYETITPAATKQPKAIRSPSRRKGRNNGYWGDEFLDSREWQEMRYRVLVQYGRKCMACGTTRGEMHVDHIKPRSKYPELALEFTNLQVLCRGCNKGKGAWDETDWRPKQESAEVFFVEFRDPDRTGAKLT